jgi:hypothetical protein
MSAPGRKPAFNRPKEKGARGKYTAQRLLFPGIPEFKIESGIKTLAKAWGVRTPNRRSSRKSK